MVNPSDVTILTEQDPIADPIDITVCDTALKRHQLTLLSRCRSLESDSSPDMMTRVGVICDKPGAGKSYVALALCTGAPPNPQSTLTSVFANNAVSLTLPNTRRRHEMDVIVVPHTIVLQWQRYVAHFPKLRCVSLRRNKSINDFVRDDVAMDNTDVVLVVNTMYNNFALQMNRNKHVRRVFFDEADSIDIPGSIQLNADFTWFITASSQVLLSPRGNSVWNAEAARIDYTTSLRASGWISNVFTSLRAVPPVFKKRMFLKNADAYVDASFMLPDLIVAHVTCQSGKHLRVFNGLGDARLLTFLNAHDLSGALSLINPSLRDTEANIIAAFVQEHEQRLHNLTVELEGCSRMMFHDAAHRERKEAHVRTEIQHVEDLIRGIRERVMIEDMCPVCLSDEYQGKVVMRCCQKSLCLECSHKFITTCAANSNKCPWCRATMQHDGFLVVDESALVRPDPIKDKFAAALEIISKATDSQRFLVFSHHTTPLTTLGSKLASMNIVSNSIKGRSACVDKLLASFVSGEVKVLLANSGCYGSGLNIDATTDIIIFHRMSTDIENQIIGRAQRPGRTTQLKVWYLMYENEL
jgi:hypothetical protein